MEENCHRNATNDIEVEKAKQFIDSNNSVIEREAERLALLSSSVRLKIVLLLANFQKLCVCDLSTILKVKQSAISQHLRKLKDGGILNKNREGLTIYYYIDIQKNPDILGLLNTLFRMKG